MRDLSDEGAFAFLPNHGYVVDTDNLDPSLRYRRLRMSTTGWARAVYTGKNIFTVQYHPEACPGPRDSAYLFDRFMKMMEESK